MKWSKWLENWDMTSLKISLKFLEMEWTPHEPDRDAAWELYIELLTRTATQPMPADHGDKTTALNSVYSLFPLTREIIKRHGRDCIEFTKIAVVVLNQIVRPFTTKWHRKKRSGAFDGGDECDKFRVELAQLQCFLRKYSMMLADMSGVENLTALEDTPS
jgi:hypothetical protein